MASGVGFEGLDHLKERVLRYERVGVEAAHELGIGVLQPEVERRVLAALVLFLIKPDLRVVRELLRGFPGVVGRAVVYDDDGELVLGVVEL